MGCILSKSVRCWDNSFPLSNVTAHDGAPLQAYPPVETYASQSYTQYTFRNDPRDLTIPFPRIWREDYTLPVPRFAWEKEDIKFNWQSAPKSLPQKKKRIIFRASYAADDMFCLSRCAFK